MSLKSFFTSRVFLLNVLLALGITVAVFFAVLFTLGRYTRHGQAYPVPDFSALDLSQVRTLSAQNDLQYVVIDSAYLRTAKPGTVIAQSPAAGFLVKRGRKIFLTVCASKPEQVMVPRLTGISLRQAISTMESVGLNLGHIDYQPSAPRDLVMAQKYRGADIKSGRLIDKGTVIDLVVGQGSGSMLMEIPDLKGMTIEAAKQALATHYLNVGGLIFDETVVNASDSAAACVWQQLPPPSSSENIDPVNAIVLWLTLNKDKYAAPMSDSGDNNSDIPDTDE
ncbi:MAG: PASTA domain-containing protein [Bacteroidales bacterium]|jgi:hypothetical protein|nr:PASTA domain-containing protein [Bacteroidales bacterium]